jgi:C4-dicarboxylate-specific signal transduction histidine kinase
MHFARLHTAGEMILEIAHEINQPLSAISHYSAGCLERLRHKKNIPQEISQAMERIILQSERAGGIVHRLKNFLRKSKLKKESIGVNAVIQEAVDFMEYQLNESGIGLKLDLDASSPYIYGNKIHILHVIINIIQNAIDAMKKQNTRKSRLLTIKTHTADNINSVNLIFSNTGPLIQDKHINKIFSPFFTTKKHGIGMGLAIAKSVIEAHKGSINITSTPILGTAFHLILPQKNVETEAGIENI